MLIRVLLFALAFIRVHHACDDDDQQQFGREDPAPYDYWPNEYYRPSSRVPSGEFRPYSKPNRRPASATLSQYMRNAEDVITDRVENRLLGLGLYNSLLLNNANSAVSPFANSISGLFSRLPVMLNPNAGNALNTAASCTAVTGESGICALPTACNLVGGRTSGTCSFGKICCINVMTKCGGVVSLNNTYWQSPTAAVSSPSTCALTVRLDNNDLVEKARPICQVRLDFQSFSIAQPNAETVCATDTFQAVGAINKVPTICGDNAGQHMYLHVPSTASTSTDLQLIFNFGSSTATRAWNIKVSMLPCGANYLAPTECLQYFTTASGTVSSFNWRDVTGTATRQLANQDYRICFRTEVVNTNQRSGTTCFTPCSVTNAATAFSLSQANSAATGVIASVVPGQSQNLLANCNNDYLIINGGYNPAVALTTTTNAWDRYCGEILNPLVAQTASVTVCSTARPYTLLYRTNGDETTSNAVDGAVGANTRGNLGFCLSFQQAA